jgi:transcriptional regulator with XRE-family HTH domain
MTSKRQRQEEAGRWLRRERERRGLRTAGALARLMGVSDSLVSRIETGHSAVTNERAEQIANALDMDVIEVRRNLGLWVPEDEPPTLDEINEQLDENQRNIAELLERARRMDARRQRALIEVARAMDDSDEPSNDGSSRSR